MNEELQNPYFRKTPWGSQTVRGFGDSEGGEDTGPSQGQSSNYMQGITSGLAAGAANSQPVGDFNVDQYAGFKGSGQGLMSGGVIGAIVGGVTAQAGQFSKINKNLKNLQTGVQGVTYDAYGRPVYQGGNVTNAGENVDALNTGVKKLNKTHLDPATNIISSFSGTRRKMKRKRDELQRGIQQAQQEYNTADVSYRQQMNQRSEYYDKMNDNSRLYNIYRAQY